jgi:hypothetical protein
MHEQYLAGLYSHRGKINFLAYAAGVSSGTVRRLKNKQTHQPQFRTVLGILRALGYDLTLVRTGENQITERTAMRRAERAMGRRPHLRAVA